MQNSIQKVTQFILENRVELCNENFDIDKFDLRVMKENYWYSPSISMMFQVKHPKSYELINMKEFPEYLMWYKGKRKLELYL